MRKFIYLISPKIINKDFYDNLREVLSSRKVEFFQLRLKKHKRNDVIKEAKKIKKITNKYKVKLIINDFSNLIKIVKADGCHLGQNDGQIKKLEKFLKIKLLV